MKPLAWIVTCAALFGCSTRPLDLPPDAAAGGSASKTPSGATSLGPDKASSAPPGHEPPARDAASAPPFVPPDGAASTTAEVAVAPPPGPDARPAPPPSTRPLSCADLMPGAPEALTGFHWQIQREACSSSACVDFHDVGAKCELSFQRRDVRRTAIAGAADCRALAQWATSRPVMNVLQGPQLCPDRQDRFEAFEVTLSGVRAAMKTFQCPDPALDALRRCVSEVFARYFP